MSEPGPFGSDPLTGLRDLRALLGLAHGQDAGPQGVIPSVWRADQGILWAQNVADALATYATLDLHLSISPAAAGNFTKAWASDAAGLDLQAGDLVFGGRPRLTAGAIGDLSSAGVVTLFRNAAKTTWTTHQNLWVWSGGSKPSIFGTLTSLELATGLWQNLGLPALLPVPLENATNVIPDVLLTGGTTVGAAAGVTINFDLIVLRPQVGLSGRSAFPVSGRLDS